MQLNPYPDPNKKVGSIYTQPNEIKSKEQNRKDLVGCVYCLIVALLIISLSGCTAESSEKIQETESKQNDTMESGNKFIDLDNGANKKIEETKIILEEEKYGYGNLCSDFSECYKFCHNNRGQCENFCTQNPAHSLCNRTIAKPQKWVPDVITQPVPEGASKARLKLPASIDKIALNEIGAFGAHHGGHLEGLDHEWIGVEEGMPVGSWGNGEVVYVGPPNPGQTDYFVVIYYGDGLWGTHMAVKTPLVKEGDKVKAGDPVAYGLTFGIDPEYQFAEFNLADQHRQDGVKHYNKFVNGAFVSPFDYLEEDEKKKLEDEWRKNILEHISKGERTGIIEPWEPYLTNPMLIHQNRTVIGEWYLRDRKWAKDEFPDVLTLLSANTKYYAKNRITGVTDKTGETQLSGTWEVDYKSNKIIIKDEMHNSILYGIFELDETGPRAILKIEYQKENYPVSFSDNAMTYIERDDFGKSGDSRYVLGVVD